MSNSIPHRSTRRQLLRAGVAAAIGSWAALEVISAAPASAQQNAPVASNVAARISVVGDSLTSGTLPFQPEDLANAGWSHSIIDAHAGRGVRTKMRADHYTGLTAVDAIRDKWGDTDAWVVGLGTNDAALYSRVKQAEVIGQMMDHIGTGHKVMWINIYLPDRKPLQHAWNSALEGAKRDNEMFVYDWASFAAENPQWLARDRMHYTSDGYRFRSTAIGVASRELLPSQSASPLPPRWRSPRMKLLPE